MFNFLEYLHYDQLSVAALLIKLAIRKMFILANTFFDIVSRWESKESKPTTLVEVHCSKKSQRINNTLDQSPAFRHHCS